MFLTKRGRAQIQVFFAFVIAFFTVIIPSGVAWAEDEIKNEFSILTNGMQSGSVAKSGWDEPLILQVVTSLPANSENLTFEIQLPDKGVTAQIQDKDSDLSTKLQEPLEVAGVAGSKVPGLTITQSGNNPIIKGGSGHYFRVSLDADSFSFIKSNGYPPATASSIQSSKKGITTGGDFALTFEVTLNDSAMQNNEVISQVFSDGVGSAQKSVTIENKTGTPAMPVISQAVLYNGLIDGNIRQKAGNTPHRISFIDDKTAPKFFTPGEEFSIQVQTSLPDPAQMSGRYSLFYFELFPSTGLSVQAAFDVAGIPCEKLPSGCLIKGLSDSQWLKGEGTRSYVSIQLNAADISYIENNGFSPATETEPASKPKQFLPGDPFAITFPAKANVDIAQIYSKAQAYYSNNDNPVLSSAKNILLIPIEGEKYYIKDTQSESSLQILDSQGLVTSNTTYPENQWIEMQALVTMPTPTTLPWPHSLGITVTASKGITLRFNSGKTYETSQYMQIAGLSLTTLYWHRFYTQRIENVPLNSKGLPASEDVSSYTMSIPGDSLEDSIEPFGLSPATSESKAGTSPAGIAPGDKFAFTFYVKMNDQATENNFLTVEVGDVRYDLYYTKKNGMLGKWLDTPYKMEVALHPALGCDLAVTNKGLTGKQTFSLPSDSISAPSANVKNAFSLQVSPSLLSGLSSITFFLKAPKGVTLDGGEALNDITLGGIPADKLPDPVSAFPDNATIQGGANSSPLELKLDSADISYIEKHEKNAPSDQASTETEYNLDAVIWGYLNEESSFSSNEITAWVDEQAQGSSCTSENATVEIFRNSPVQPETHFIKNGYETRKESGWGVSTEGTQETLQISIVMPSEEAIEAYKRMVIQVEPEKGVTAMSWAPRGPRGRYYNSTNWKDIYLAGYDLHSWQKHGLLYTIYPNAGNEWITNGSSWNVALNVKQLNYIQQSGQIAATNAKGAIWSSGVKQGERFSLKLPVYLNSDSAQSGNLVKVSVYWGDSPSNGSASISVFDIVKNADDLPSPLPFTGGIGAIWILLGLVLLGSSFTVLGIYRKREE